ncbi:histidinol-phosphatase [Endozoicomonas numazuensis]|uniref:Phosphoserine phosphatase n=1 Tax=Endozoicomonas numazuensis TaxID=1137799 RepID=A0A081ND57_9GAMM|nr:HAD family hydrolase [Endozoicomonas numazuensis]KEQ16380.1 phosphoserine phosphatase [Endozoicomonas numazuensis]
MALAIFDLDNTLIAGDSDYLWGQFMANEGMVDAVRFHEGNDHFYRQYEAGTMVLSEYLDFCLEPLTQFTLDELKVWHDKFMEQTIRPIMLEKAASLLKKHRDQGDYLMIITATSRFVTEPIARALDVDTLLAIELDIEDNRYTGKVVGTPTYQEGKVIRLKQWLQENPEYSLEGSYFYSDSKNDLPLLNQVEHPFAVDSDPELTAVATEKGWSIISLR